MRACQGGRRGHSGQGLDWAAGLRGKSRPVCAVCNPPCAQINQHELPCGGAAAARDRLRRVEAGNLYPPGQRPGLGVFQMEPATHFDLWDRYIRYRMELKLQLLHMIPPDMHGKVGGAPSPDLLITDLRYAAIMARLFTGDP